MNSVLQIIYGMPGESQMDLYNALGEHLSSRGLL